MKQNRFNYAGRERETHEDSLFEMGGETFKITDVCANRHKGNPESQAAFESIKDKLTKAQEKVLLCIRNHDGITCEEIEDTTGMSHQTTSARCSDLKRLGKIRKEGTRLTRSGHSAAILIAI